MDKHNLIVIEGLDGSGKGTQTALLRERILSAGYAVRHISFPNYSETSAALVKSYLAGEFGSTPESVNAYAASSFYAVDRYAACRPIHHFQRGLSDDQAPAGEMGQLSRMVRGLRIPSARTAFAGCGHISRYAAAGFPAADVRQIQRRRVPQGHSRSQHILSGAVQTFRSLFGW